ncbi:uncharacterized protein EV154DRAFT_492510 [Mucor mucedo]|uniref:uncharacterized protein n=1 Tax=Mucor mucedo TaxID=29922 RepID=UPI002220AB08|nr:uncharacterized protein EV154DRAFT_492510 [Mucor mucedo]KAI7896510.1 hypothetical protein EV154DRAFT_492510 [Mucor mucedo]
MMLSVHPMSFTHASDFHIQLDDTHIILHGSAEESAGSILRGSVILNCQEQIKVKSVTLKLIGITKVNWSEGNGPNQRNYRAKQVLIEKELTFLESGKKPHVCQGRYKWDFELPLPGNIPESIHHDMGQVYYRLKAYCDRPKFSMNFVDKQMIQVSRQMLASNLEFNQSVNISNIWANKVQYDITIPSKIYAAGQKIPIAFDLFPIAPQLTIRSVACSLKEYTTGSTQDRQKTKNCVLNQLRDDHFYPDPITGHILKTELLLVPQRIHFDMCAELIQVKHKIKFTVSLQNSDGHISELRASIPVIIAPTVPQHIQEDLPPYQDAWRSSHIPLSESYSSLSSSNHSSDTEEEHWMTLSRVPSYTTALRNNIPCSSSSLPSYYESTNITTVINNNNNNNN